MQQEANSKYIRMTTEPIPKLICTLAVPTIISMLVTALYNIADTFFVGRLGTEATAGVGLVFPIMAVVTITNMLYQNIGRVVGATLLAVARQGLMFIPVVLILPHMFKKPIWGVYLAQPTADLFAFALALVLAVRMYRELREKEKTELS